jgi:hypothetical protein
VVDTEVDPPQQNSISRESDDEPQKKPFSLARRASFGRPTGMVLRTDSIFLKRENVPTTSDEDGVTKLEQCAARPSGIERVTDLYSQAARSL